MRYLILLFALLVHTTVFAQVSSKTVKAFDSFIKEGIATWQPPALAVAVVKDGTPVFLKAYGVRNISNPIAVDEHTLFLCASTTKAFTAAALAILVDEGKVEWDDKVIKHLPGFKLKDPFMTRELTVRDLLTHRSGLGNTDYLWTTMKIPGDSAIMMLDQSDFAYSPRAGFIYQNLMYSTAGEVVEAASGMSWAEFLQKRIYTPLGMTNTYPYLKNVLTKTNKVSGHYWQDDSIIPIEQLSADEIGPAGSMWSDISDMAKWLTFLTNNGMSNGDTIISSTNFEELFKPQQIVPPGQFYPSQQLTQPNWRTYGLGWFQHDYKGQKVDFHTGSLPGMVAIAGLIREDNLGVYVFSNLDHVELRHAIMYAAFDLFTEGKLSRNWSDDLKAIYDERIDEDEEPLRIENAPPIIPTDSLIGTYINKQRGKIDITRRGSDLRFSLNETITGSLSHWHYDVYQLKYDRTWYGEGMVNFRMNSAAKIEYLELWGLKFTKTDN